MKCRHKTACATLAVAWAFVGAACRSTPAPPREDPTFSVTHWTERTELFMEHPALVAEKTTRFAVHLTTLADFRPLGEGHTAIELTGADGGRIIKKSL